MALIFIGMIIRGNHLIDLKTLVITPLTDTPINESEIAWSPGGNFMAYHAKVNDRNDIFVINLATKEVSKVTTAEAYHGEPTWFLE